MALDCDPLVNGKDYGIGDLELVPLQSLRERVKSAGGLPGRLKVGVVTGDVRQMHRSPENAGALFQVASQFNLLEMVSPMVTPEQSVTRYQDDHTQGPACAIAAGAATIYRNYFAPVSGSHGQTTERQLDGLADLGWTLAAALNWPVKALWDMQNGYALCTRAGLDGIREHLSALSPDQLDILRGQLRIGIHRDVEVTDIEGRRRRGLANLLFGAPGGLHPRAAVPTGRHSHHWSWKPRTKPRCRPPCCNARRGASNVVLLTQLGGGAFGNRDDWIYAAMRRSLEGMRELDSRCEAGELWGAVEGDRRDSGGFWLTTCCC